MKKILKNKIKFSIIIIVSLCLLSFGSIKKATSQNEIKCKEIPIGTTAKRAQEIREILIKDLFFIKEKFEEEFAPARKIADLAFIECRNGEKNCSGICLLGAKSYCYSGDSCPPDVRKELNQKLEEIKNLNSLIQGKAKEIEELIKELEEKKKEIKEMEKALAERSLEREVLYDCFSARRLGYIEKEKCFINDYYICKIK